MRIDAGPEGAVAEDMVEAASRAGRDEERRRYLGMSQIGDPCERKLWLQFRGYTPADPDGRAQMVFSLGDRVEEETLRWLELAGYEVDGRQRAFEALGGLFRGHCDGVVHGVTRSPHVLEIKSANASRFKMFQTSGVAQVSPTYAAQIQCYMGYSGLERALWVVMNKNTCELHVERARFDRDEFQRLEAKARRIIWASEPPEPAFGEGARDCRWCGWSARCRGGVFPQLRTTCGTCVHCVPDPGAERFDCDLHGRTIERWGGRCDSWEFRDATDRVPF